MAKNKTNIRIFESSDKEFIISKSFIISMCVLLFLTAIAILNLCGFDVQILKVIVKVFDVLSKLYFAIPIVIIIFGLIAYKYFKNSEHRELLFNKENYHDPNKKKDLIYQFIKLGIIFILFVLSLVLNLVNIVRVFFLVILKLHKITKYISIIWLVVTYLVQDSITGEIAEKKGYGKTNGALLGLIPFFGIVYYTKMPKRRNVQNATIRNSYSGKELLHKYLIFAELAILSVIVILPVIYMIGASLTDLTSLPTTFWPNKDHFTFENYKYLFTETKYWVWFKNTFIIALINMVGGVLFITGAGYVFARFKFKGKKVGLITILVLQVFPTFMSMVALFTLYETFGLVGSPTALSIIYVGGSIPGNIWLIKGYLQQLPRDLDESAMLDGANKLQIFTKIILPLSVPILSFVAVSMFMSPWMDYILPSYLLDILPASKTHLISSTVTADDLIKEQWTIAVGLHNMISDAKSADYTTFAAGSIIIALPITILYVCFQRFLIEGITAGATKG